MQGKSGQQGCRGRGVAKALDVRTATQMAWLVAIGLVLCILTVSANAGQTSFHAKYGPNIVIAGSEHQVRRLRFWLDEIYKVPSGRATLRAITQSKHSLVIRHSHVAVIAAGRVAAPLTENLSNGRGESVQVAFNADIPDSGSHIVFDGARKPLEYTAVQNLYHELAHAMHQMSGTWLYFASERQAIEAENQFRREQALRRRVDFRPRFFVSGKPVCDDAPQGTPRRWGQELICN